MFISTLGPEEKGPRTVLAVVQVSALFGISLQTSTSGCVRDISAPRAPRDRLHLRASPSHPSPPAGAGGSSLTSPLKPFH